MDIVVMLSMHTRHSSMLLTSIMSCDLSRKLISLPLNWTVTFTLSPCMQHVDLTYDSQSS